MIHVEFARKFRVLLRGVAGVLMPSPGLYRKIEKSAAALQGKGWGAATTADEVRFCLQMIGHPPDVFIDVGANKGIYTSELLARLPNIECHLFEPSPHNLALLEDLFGQRDNVEIAPIALSDVAGSGTLFADEPGSGLASLTKRQLEFLDMQMNHEDQVQIQRFDEYWLADRGGPIDYVKIDVEGHELDVLKGFGDLLSQTRLVQFEFGGTNIDTRTFFQDFWNLFSQAGFALYRLSPLGPIAIKVYDVDLESFVCTNYIAVNTNSLSRLSAAIDRDN